MHHTNADLVVPAAKFLEDVNVLRLQVWKGIVQQLVQLAPLCDDLRRGCGEGQETSPFTRATWMIMICGPRLYSKGPAGGGLIFSLSWTEQEGVEPQSSQPMQFGTLGGGELTPP